MNKRIWLSSPHMGTMERKFVDEAFDTNWISPLGPNLDGFEKDLEIFLGENVHVAALQSGTAALHLALLLLNVKQGDEVLCQSMTFAASANPITYAGATPVFVDSERETWNISPALLEKAILERKKKGKLPKALILVHLYGMPANLKEILEITQKHEIALIEDAAESLGSTYQGRNTGTFGDISVLSFNGNKIITTSGGGALVSKNPDYASRARFLSTQARDSAVHYEHSVIGYNYRLSNICAGIGRGQMTVLKERVQQRRKVFNYYLQALNGLHDIEFLHEPGPDYFSNRWLTTILLKNYETREKIREQLALVNIESRPLWKPMHLQRVFNGAPAYVNGVSEDLFTRGLCLPSGSNLEESDLEGVVRQLKSAF